jgi:thiol:disulfide interchange protein DsbD
MRKLQNVLILLFLFQAYLLNGQMIKPVSWFFETKQVSDNEVLLISKAKMLPHWHLYGQFFEDGGPIKLSFSFEKSANFGLLGKVVESPSPIKSHDEIFDMEVQYFDNEASFTQKIKVLSETDFVIDLYLEGQACLDDGQCVQIEAEHSFQVKGAKKAVAQQETNKTTETIIVADTADVLKNTVENEDTLQTVIQTTEVKPNEASIKAATKSEDVKSLWIFFFVAFGAGLITLLTPCVFPVVPMTVSFFMHNQGSKAKGKFQALFYGFSIVAIYTLPILVLNILTAFLGANFIEADFANTLSTHWFFNILFTIIFLIFAASFFGLFEITLPSWMVDKADKQADKGGLLGVFFMAFTLVLVSFSCTGPIVGSIVVQSLTGLQVDGGVSYTFGELFLKYGEPTIGMLGFSLGVAVPFTLFALFPSWLKNLPKSGGWLNSVKVVLGFLELALALKFLSVSDQAYHWGLLDREVYLALWIVIFTLMGFYLLGKIKFSGDSDLQHVSVSRLMFSIISFSFVVYMIPGMFGAPLKALSGYLPPLTGQDFDIQRLIREGGTGMAAATYGENKSICETPKYADKLHLPHGIKGYYDFEQGLACAKKLGKPVFLDFTGHGCTNCRKMEENVWSNPDVLKRLKENFVVISLYVDDKTILPENEWITSAYDGKVKKTIGKKYADFQISKFGVNAQPYYIIMDSDGNMLHQPHAFDTSIESFISFLDAGLAEYNKK